MNTALYYFSGTGNSLSVARSLKSHIKGSKLYSIVACSKQKSIDIKAERVGFVFPMHFMTVPRIVIEFLEKARFYHPKHVFVIVTGASPKFGNALSQVEKYLCKAKVTLNAGYFIQMVAAHFPYLKLSKDKLPTQLYQEAEEKLLHISENILQQKNEFDKEFTILGTIKQIVPTEVKRNESHFTVGEGCIRCGYCMQVCPFQNIRLHGKKVQWMDNCHYCFACLHFCSKSVIEYKRLSVGRPRHHHPSIELNDISMQRG